MAVDYEQIRNENIREYGEGTRHLAFFERLYSDGAHFILEILQNAEDAGARAVDFVLTNDLLEIRHSGREFNDRDVRGICGVGESTKDEDYTQIGRFGIGFKSVYAYTDTPAIHCRGEHFEIQHYVRPFQIRPRRIEKPWTTLIVLPFNKASVDPDHAHSEIGKRLRNLSSRTLLFLSNVAAITYSIDSEYGKYERRSTRAADASLVSVSSSSSSAPAAESEQWLVFSRSVVLEEGGEPSVPRSDTVPPLQLAFLLEDTSGQLSRKPRSVSRHGKNGRESLSHRAIVPLDASPLTVFFPTEVESGLGFLLHGPFRTTPARDNIPTQDTFNLSLIRQAAEYLATYVLRSIRDNGLLNVAFFDVLPLETGWFREDEFLRPVAAAVRDSLVEEDLLPSADGGFVSGRKAVLGRGQDIRGLLSTRQLHELFGINEGVQWLSGDITSDNAPGLRTYLRTTLSILEVTPETMAPRITDHFLEQQSDEWMARFYECLLGWEALWKQQRGMTAKTALRDRPIIRLEDERHVSPFDKKGNPQAYLPAATNLQLPVVRHAIVRHASAREFLVRLGLTEPDIVIEVIEDVISKYTCGGPPPSAAEHQRHIAAILAAWQTDSKVKHARLKEALVETPFVRYRCRGTGEQGYARPGDVYIPTNDLVIYFEGTPDAKFAVTSYTAEVRDFLGTTGVASVPRCVSVGYGEPSSPERPWIRGIVENVLLDGLAAR